MAGWGKERCAPDTDHVEHVKKQSIQSRQHTGVLDDLMDNSEPLDKAVLSGRRRLALALAKCPHDSNDDICGYSLGGVKILDQRCDRRLI
jgi:hypothetical protein